MLWTVQRLVLPRQMTLAADFDGKFWQGYTGVALLTFMIMTCLT